MDNVKHISLRIKIEISTSEKQTNGKHETLSGQE